ncbi:glycerophosphodiester phosphodiesterase family protein [Rhizobium binxianense]
MKYIDHIADPTRPCAIVAHRGAWHRAPENSLAAIENAIAAGYDIVEVDIRQSADGGLFLLHDDTLERMAGIDRRPEELTIAELNGLTLRMADGGADKVMTRQTIPTLEQVLETARGRVFLDLDIKDTAGLVGAVAARVKALGMADQVDLKERADSPEMRSWIAKETALDGIPFMAKAHFNLGDADETAQAVISVRPFMCESGFDRLETLAGQHQRFRSAGISLWVNTLDAVSHGGFTDSAALGDPDAVWGRLIEAGVSVIQTDEPEALKAYIGARRT